jgi:hypothetical protein
MRVENAASLVAPGRQEITRLQRARWHRMLGEAHQQLGEANAARHHLERALEHLGLRMPASTAGWLAMLAAQVGSRALRGLRRRGPDERRRERAAACFAVNEVYWVLEEHFPMLPAAICALNDAERAGDPDLLVRTQAGVGMMVGGIGLHRLARRHLGAAAAAVERTSDPLTACWVGIVGGLHWTGFRTAGCTADARRVQALLTAG